MRDRCLAVAAGAVILMLCGCSHSRTDGSTAAANRGGLASGNVKLVRASPAIVRAACDEAQRHTRLLVRCPTLLPRTRYVRQAGLSGLLDFGPSYWAITFNNGYDRDGYVHWIAGSGTRRAVQLRDLSDAENEVKGLPRLVSRSRTRGHLVAVYQYPDYPAGGPNGSHTAAFVSCRGGLVVFASIHGHDEASAATAMAVDLAVRSRCH
jgi:hypothetical protein